MRDSQRARLYNAESNVEWGSASARLSLAESQQFVDGVLADIWWRNRSGIRSIKVTAGARNGRAWAGGVGLYGATIRTAPDSRKPWVLIHELAHHLTTSPEAHGAQYAANYVALVQRYIGVAQANDLQAQFKLRRVKCRGVAKVRSIEQRTRVCDCGKRYRLDRAWQLRVSNATQRWCSKRCLMAWVERNAVRPS